MSRQLRLLIRIAFFAGVLATIRVSSQQVSKSSEPIGSVTLGVLEDFPGEYAGESDFRAVRATFKRVNDDWQAFPTKTKTYRDLESLPMSYPKEMTWTITFDGKNLGTVMSQTPSHFRFYSEIGIEHITSKDPIPTVGSRSKDYSADSYTPVYRPLVAVSQPNTSDPEGWKRT